MTNKITQRNYTTTECCQLQYIIIIIYAKPSPLTCRLFCLFLSTENDLNNDLRRSVPRHYNIHYGSVHSDILNDRRRKTEREKGCTHVYEKTYNNKCLGATWGREGGGTKVRLMKNVTHARLDGKQRESKKKEPTKLYKNHASTEKHESMWNSDIGDDATKSHPFLFVFVNELLSPVQPQQISV